VLLEHMKHVVHTVWLQKLTAPERYYSFCKEVPAANHRAGARPTTSALSQYVVGHC